LPGMPILPEVLSAQPPFILVVDIILTLLLFYQIFLILRGSKAIPLLNGLGIIFLLGFLSEFVRFYIFSGLLKYILGILVIAIPVLFQSELRRALEQLGKQNSLARFFKWTSLALPKTLKAVADAAERMAAERIGGLIVLEYETPLDQVIESGVKLDAIASCVLVRQIFAKNTPLHDGAVVIRGSRIAAASCLLPLSTRTDLPVEWGTRHRAGFGLSEITDAIVIVISEERGSITLIHNGEYRPVEGGEALALLLDELVAAKVKRPKDQSCEEEQSKR
jgi:diadenylate cyclase